MVSKPRIYKCISFYISPSIAHDTINVPSWLKLTAVTGSECAGRTFIDFPTRRWANSILSDISHLYLWQHPILAQSHRSPLIREDSIGDCNWRRRRNSYGRSRSLQSRPEVHKYENQNNYENRIDNILNLNSKSLLFYHQKHWRCTLHHHSTPHPRFRESVLQGSSGFRLYRRPIIWSTYLPLQNICLTLQW